MLLVPRIWKHRYRLCCIMFHAGHLKSALWLEQPQTTGQGRKVSNLGHLHFLCFYQTKTPMFSMGQLDTILLEGRHLRRTLSIKTACSKSQRLQGLTVSHRPESIQPMSENSTTQRLLPTEIPKNPHMHSLREPAFGQLSGGQPLSAKSEIQEAPAKG